MQSLEYPGRVPPCRVAWRAYKVLHGLDQAERYRINRSTFDLDIITTGTGSQA